MSLFAVAVQILFTETNRPKSVPTWQCPCEQSELHEDLICQGWSGRTSQWREIVMLKWYASNFMSMVYKRRTYACYDVHILLAAQYIRYTWMPCATIICDRYERHDSGLEQKATSVYLDYEAFCWKVISEIQTIMWNQLGALFLLSPWSRTSFPSQQGSQTETHCPLQYELTTVCILQAKRLSWLVPEIVCSKKIPFSILRQALFHIIMLIAMNIMDYWGWRNNATLYSNPMAKWCSCISLQLNHSRWRCHLRSKDSTRLSYSGFLYAEPSTATERRSNSNRRTMRDLHPSFFFPSCSWAQKSLIETPEVYNSLWIWGEKKNNSCLTSMCRLLWNKSFIGNTKHINVWRFETNLSYKIRRLVALGLTNAEQDGVW